MLQPLITLHVFYNGSKEEGRANFKSFFDLSKLAAATHSQLTLQHLYEIDPISDFTKETPYEELNAAQVGIISIHLIH